MDIGTGSCGRWIQHLKALHDRRSVQLGVAYGYNISEVTERLFMNGQQNSPPAAAAVGITAAGL